MHNQGQCSFVSGAQIIFYEKLNRFLCRRKRQKFDYSKNLKNYVNMDFKHIILLVVLGKRMYYCIAM